MATRFAEASSANNDSGYEDERYMNDEEFYDGFVKYYVWNSIEKVLWDKWMMADDGSDDDGSSDDGGNSSDVDLLKEQLKSLSTELVTLRSSLKEGLSTDDPPHDAMKRDMIVRHCAHSSVYSTLEDLIHLSGPLTEDAIVRALQTRFYNADFYYTYLWSSSGVSGSGKTYASMQLLRQLFDIAGGGPETDTFKHLSAAFTVLRSLGNAKTVSNTESSRMGQFIEVHVTDGALYRTKIHCYFIDQSRIVKPQRHEKNFHIFYQMLAGLTQDEKVKLYLEGFSAHSLRYLSQGDTNQNEAQDAARFDTWKIRRARRTGVCRRRAHTGSSNGSLRSEWLHRDLRTCSASKKSQENGFEQLCTNLCAETMQHFYNTHIFKSTLECAKDEGIQCEIDVDYTDNAPCIELISSQRTGLLSLLDSESLLPRSTNESYVQRVRVQHRMNPGCSNDGQEADLFDRETVVHQIRGLEVLETVNLMAEGFSHRMRFKAFSNNYRFLLRSPLAVKTDNKAYEESKAILERLSQILSESNTPFSSSSWAVGQKHIFLSELTRQQLETLRQRRRNQAATVLQKNVLRWRAVRRWPSLRRTLEMRRKNWNHRPTPPRPAKSSALMSRPRPQPIIDTSDALEISRLCDKSTVQATINAYGLDMENAPPIPAKRTYTVTGNAKVGFPHTRVIVNTYQEDGRADRTLMKGEPVKVVGKSRKSGYLLVEHKNGFSIDVPFQYLSLPEKPNKC
ncbi:PREDICTED: uncharacterized protein LOC106807743 [Priapulus caudatus]|uniref:Uncharacterized protein LOC106807743 n=1 Tax=Priapulus caudatus TaxID=37621 RepID=A0ABM1E0G0_PRICU|nr:PREDICTED: uncharacterized protein LOC106807743 [Priapulus caudatus]